MAPHHLATIVIGTCCLWANDISAFSSVPSVSRLTTTASSSSSTATLPLRLANDNQDENDELATDNQRREIFHRAGSFVLATTAALSSTPAYAGIDPSALKALPVEGDTTGITTRLRQIESVNGPRPEDSKDIAFEVLPSGASYREYREGKGEATIAPGSKVAAEMTIRAKSFATANEPGGVKYFSTKTDTDFNELAWTVGSGELPPALEECMMGMRKNSIRRIELPSTLVFAARNANQLPVPVEGNKDGKRVYDRLFKTDATLLFEVLVTRIK
mmetsp:Transcript_11526/g.24570  ORF Transcript_11526/g.24570 Transcript_11526/m.24570 type:complete len:274 (-) Transcript_11526:331-1152(-)